MQTLQNEGDMQSSLMPQELNPEFMPDKVILGVVFNSLEKLSYVICVK